VHFKLYNQAPVSLFKYDISYIIDIYIHKIKHCMFNLVIVLKMKMINTTKNTKNFKLSFCFCFFFFIIILNYNHSFIYDDDDVVVVFLSDKSKLR
jgi:hypothetical protein